MRYILSTLALTLGALSPSLAAADEEEVVVTATRTPTPLDRLPARVDVIDRSDIEAAGIATLPEAIGASAVQSGGAGQQTSLFLRGANSKHALALFDGVRLNDAAAPNGQYDFGLDTLGALDRIEVLRGPASSIYGSDAIGGVVNLIPRRGGDRPFAPYGEFALGSFETHRLLLGASGDASGFAYGVSAEAYETEGYDLIPERMSTFTGEADGARMSTLTATVRHDGAISWDALLRLRDSEAEFDTFSGGPFFDLRAEDDDLGNDAQQTLWRLGADATPLDGVTVRLSGGQVLSERTEHDGGFQASAAQSEHSFIDLTATRRSERLTLTGGASFAADNIETSPMFANALRVSEDQAGLYAIADLDLNAVFSATASVRADHYESFGTHGTYALGLVADLQPLRLFASYGTAFKAPSLSERFETSFFNAGNPALDPERSRSWEIGADWQAREWLRAGGSYYQTRISDLIEYNFAQLRNINVGEAAIDGAETYVEASPATWATLRATYAWTDARNDATGAQLARRPEHSWRAELSLRPSERITLTGAWTYVGSRTDVTYGDTGAFQSATGRAPSFSTGAIAATFDLSDEAQLFLRIDNLSDVTFEQPAAFAGPPRSTTLGLRATF